MISHTSPPTHRPPFLSGVRSLHLAPVKVESRSPAARVPPTSDLRSALRVSLDLHQAPLNAARHERKGGVRTGQRTEMPGFRVCWATSSVLPGALPCSLWPPPGPPSGQPPRVPCATPVGIPTGQRSVLHGLSDQCALMDCRMSVDAVCNER